MVRGGSGDCWTAVDYLGIVVADMSCVAPKRHEREANMAMREEGIEGNECSVCGKFYIKKYEWQKQCWECFFESKAGQEGKSRNGDGATKGSKPSGWNSSYAEREQQRRTAQAQQERGRSKFWSETEAERINRINRQAKEYAEAMARAQQAENQRKYDQAAKEKAERENAYRKSFHDDPFKDYFRKVQQQGNNVGIDKELLRKLIMLCHPDKHGGSEMANSVTVVLLKMKEGMR